MLLIDKSPGQTSFETLSRVKRVLGTGKVGHTGTLDKFASGLLIALAGRATKQASRFEGFDKTYEAAILFGRETDTLDPEGQVVAEAPAPSPETLQTSLSFFTGAIMQAPPAYSAVHINGKRAYKIARNGEKPVMPERPVTIYSLDLLSYEQQDAASAIARIRVRCSKGTYIRSLARDIGLKAGSRAYVAELRRLAVGPYTVEKAIRLDTATDQAIKEAVLPC